MFEIHLPYMQNKLLLYNQAGLGLIYLFNSDTKQCKLLWNTMNLIYIYIWIALKIRMFRNEKVGIHGGV